MYKAAFPWSTVEEEEIEKKYIKSYPDTDSEEIAGNVWIPPETALILSEVYGMRPWIEALLDPEPIAKGTQDPNKSIATPPRFLIPTSEATTLPPPPSEAVTSRRRTLRSASPAKAPPTPSRKIATPRRTRRAKPTAANSLEPTAESAEESSVVPEASFEPESAKFDSIIASSEAIAKAAAEETDSDVVEVAPASDSIKVDIETVTEPAVNGGEPSTTTHVTVETPAGHPDLPLPTDAQGYLDQAKAAIAEANKMTAGRAAGKKRKAIEAFVEDDEVLSKFPEFDAEVAAVAPVEIDERPTKRQRMTELNVRKEKLKKRATLGILASLTVG